jgi:hypothetical protein
VPAATPDAATGSRTLSRAYADDPFEAPMRREARGTTTLRVVPTSMRRSGTHRATVPCTLDDIEVPRRGAYCSGFSQLPQALDVSGVVKDQSRSESTGSSQWSPR